MSGGIDLNKARFDDGVTPIYNACYQGHPQIVKALLECKGIAVNRGRTDTGETPLHAAAWGGELEIVRQLVAYGAKLV